MQSFLRSNFAYRVIFPVMIFAMIPRLAAAKTLAGPDQPTEVFAGVHIYSISDVNLTEGTYRFHGYIWFRWQGELNYEARPAQSEEFEFVLINGEIEQIDEARTDHDGQWHRQSRKFSARLRSTFDMHMYPFDEQSLEMIVEHRWLGTDGLVFVADDAAYPNGSLGKSSLDESLLINNWQIKRNEISHQTMINTYGTDFGSLGDNWNQQASRYVFRVPVRRNIGSYLTKFLIPLTVIVLMCFSVFFIHCSEFDPQVGIVVTALLSCIAFHISQVESLPKVGYVVMADVFFFLSYLVIFLAMVEVITANLLFHNDREKKAERLDSLSRYLFPAIFFLPAITLVLIGLSQRG